MGRVVGTFVNNRRVTAATLPESGDTVRFTGYEFEYVRTDRKRMGQTIFAKARFLKTKKPGMPALQTRRHTRSTCRIRTLTPPKPIRT
jgi:hypothetical protein